MGVLWAASMFAWFFLSALYLQLVLGYSPLQVGLAFLPANVVMGILSVGVSAKLVMRFGIKPPLAAGLLLAGTGLALFARVPVDGNFAVDVLPAMLLLGIGAGIAFNPVLLAAMSDVAPEEAGLASGLVNTAFMMGGALGLAVLASLAASRTDTPERGRRQPPGRADRGLPRGLRGGRDLRRLGGGDRRLAAAHGDSRPARRTRTRRPRSARLPRSPVESHDRRHGALGLPALPGQQRLRLDGRRARGVRRAGCLRGRGRQLRRHGGLLLRLGRGQQRR